MSRVITWLLLLLIPFLSVDAFARRSHLAPEQRDQLAHIQTIYLHVLALTEDGRVSPKEITKVVASRFEEIGYRVVIDRTLSHDVEFRVKCEEQKRWVGTTEQGGDADLPDTPARLWEGPACQFGYRLNGMDLDWHKEVRTPFEDAGIAASQAGVTKSGAYALGQLAIQLREFDFPVLAAAEWGQTHRLVELLQSSRTTKTRKLTILEIFQNTPATIAVPHLLRMIEDKACAEEAIGALSGVGGSSIPILVDLFQNPERPSYVRAAAAKGLGQVGVKTGNAEVIPPLLNYLRKVLRHMNKSDDIDFPVLTDVVWAIGQVANEQAVKLIEELNYRVWLLHDTSPEMKKLREIAHVVLKYVDMRYRLMYRLSSGKNLQS